ncbi:MAG: hypothetical protein K2N71_13045, partial [Oscillospiraceae bacterium]|nr:hypothetical protein [Oscillospiraceae bacterium]
IPIPSAKAPAEAMRTEPAPITADELSYIYIDGIKIDFPCTLADIREHFETRRYAGSYDEEKFKYTGTEILVKNGVCSYLIGYTSDSRKPLPEECIVTSVAGRIGHVGKYSPQLVIAGMDIVNTSEEEFMRLSALDMEEYLTSDLIICPQGNDGYTALNSPTNRITYYKKADPEDMATIEEITPRLIKTELRLPEDYDPETVSESKEELKEFALEYAASVTDRKYGKDIEKTVTEFYSTAYEFLAADHDEYKALYYDLTDIEGLKRWDLTDDGEGMEYYDTGYLKIKAYCCTEREEDDYPFMARTELLLKLGDRLGDALIIHIDL